MRQKLPDSLVVPGHPDYELLSKLEGKILHGAGGLDNLRADFPLMMRRIIDNVVDAPRTGRRIYDELEKTEKTYIGTRVEIELRAHLGFLKGKLDLVIDGHDVDVKHTMGSTWMIPEEAIDKPCILVAADEDQETCYLGLVIASLDHCTQGKNKDSKRSISAEGMAHVLWLVKAQPYPANFWKHIPADKIQDIFLGKSGNERIEALFTAIQATPISRDIVHAVAKQKDYMKRLRANGGARDILAKKGIILLSGTYHGDLIKQLGLPTCTRDESISKMLTTAEEKNLARAKGFPIP